MRAALSRSLAGDPARSQPCLNAVADSRPPSGGQGIETATNIVSVHREQGQRARTRISLLVAFEVKQTGERNARNWHVAFDVWVKNGAVAPVSDGPGHSLRADVLARLDFGDFGTHLRSSDFGPAPLQAPDHLREALWRAETPGPQAQLACK
jgi:hypothetical protein